MKILGVHNYYGSYGFGGESRVFETEMDLLVSKGNEVEKYTCTNFQLNNYPFVKKYYSLANTHWNKESYRAIKNILINFRPDIMHVHNTWLLLTPSIFQAAYELSIPSVMTLHNYRLACPAGQFIRKGSECVKCIGMERPWPLLQHRCYRDSLLMSLVRYRLYRSGRVHNLWKDKVGAFIALTDFAAKKFISSGLPEKKIRVKPNCVEDPIGSYNLTEKSREGAVFIGRLSEEKGLLTLLEAWKDVDYPLTIIGDGPLYEGLVSSATTNIRFLGYQSSQNTIAFLKNSQMLIFPSECTEGFGLPLIEAMACGVPIIASRYGAIKEIVKDNQTGLLFKKGDQSDLSDKINALLRDNELSEQIGKRGRKEYEEKYTMVHNYKYLVNIYGGLLDQ